MPTSMEDRLKNYFCLLRVRMAVSYADLARLTVEILLFLLGN